MDKLQFLVLITNTVCEEILMCVNLRITLVQFITMSSSTGTVSKHQEIIIKYGYLIVNHFITHL